MKVLLAAACALLLLAAVPATQAQLPVGEGISLSVAQPAAPIPYLGSIDVNVTVTYGCFDALQDGHPVLSAPDAPTWLMLTFPEVHLEPAEGETACFTGGGDISGTFPVTVQVAAQAPGVVPQSVNLTVTGNGESATSPLEFSVEYNADYEMTTDVTFPLNVTGPTASFNLTVVQKSNARSMVMMEGKSESAGSLSGLASVVYEDDARTKVFPITYKAPTGDWTNATVSFTAFSHYLLLEGGAGDFTAEQPVTWSFVNAAEPQKETSGGGKESPAPVAPLLALVLLGLAAFARRR